MNKIETVVAELKQGIHEQFEGRPYFACLYGSYAAGSATSASDVDLFVAVDIIRATDMKALIELVSGINDRYNLAVDMEVPYENKLLVSLEDVTNAVNLRPFVLDGSAPIVPEIRKEESFLASIEVRWRLLLNALTTPHIHLAGDSGLYLKYKKDAEAGLRILAANIAGSSIPTEALSAVLSNPNGEDGEMYLGYKADRPSVVSYVAHLLEGGS